MNRKWVLVSSRIGSDGVYRDFRRRDQHIRVHWRKRGAAHGIHIVFVCVSVITVLAFLISLRIPGVSKRELLSDR